VDSDIPLTTASTDNRAAAALAADKLAALIGDEGDVAVVGHDQTSRTGVERVEGFVNRLKAAHPKVRVVTVQYGGGDHLKSTEVAKSILQGHPKLKALFGTNEGSAIGVVNAVREMKRTGVTVVGFDAGKQQKDAIASGAMAGAITQNPVGIGYRTVEAAVKALKGEALPKTLDTGYYWYDKTNLRDPKIAAVLYD
jgi:ribose transport system substrate-binding protein